MPMMAFIGVLISSAHVSEKYLFAMDDSSASFFATRNLLLQVFLFGYIEMNTNGTRNIRRSH